MDENKDDFESTFEQQTNKGIYGDRVYVPLPNSVSKREITAEEILSNVANEIRNMHTADCTRSTKKPSLNIYRFRNSTFVPLNMLPRDDESPPLNHNFETQQCTDTQLIDVVKDAELKASYVNCGMTQEFESSFFQGMVEDGHGNGKQNLRESRQINPPLSLIDISLKAPDLNESLDIISSPVKLNDEIQSDNEAVYRLNSALIDKISEENKNDGTQIDNCSQILNECVGVENIDELDNLTHFSSLTQPSSPVFDVKPKIPEGKLPSALIFNLDLFENFEKIAHPIVEEITELEIAKKLINSQIFGNELLLQTNAKPILNCVEPISPIIELTGALTIDKDNFIKDITIRSTTPKENSICSDIVCLQDEILFSSDEEEDYKYKSYQDLPLTCALETSFYDQSGILEKTMYVGFQTASNKSIQVNADSFCKAKSLLDNVEEELKDNTLTQMVKICDNNNFKTKVDPVSDIIEVTTDTDLKDNNGSTSYDVRDSVNGDKYSANNKNNDLNSCNGLNKNCLKTVQSNTDDDFVISDLHFVEDDKEIADFHCGALSIVTEISDLSNNDKDCGRVFDIGMSDLKLCDFEYNSLSSANVHTDANSLKEMDIDVQNKLQGKDFKSTSHMEKVYILPNLNSRETGPRIPEGFKTASNKTLNSSEKSLSRAKVIFQDIFDEKSYCDIFYNGVPKNWVKSIPIFDKEVDSTSNNIDSHQKDCILHENIENVLNTEKIHDKFMKEFENDIIDTPSMEKADLPKDNNVKSTSISNNNVDDAALVENKKLLFEAINSESKIGFSNIKTDVHDIDHDDVNIISQILVYSNNKKNGEDIRTYNIDFKTALPKVKDDFTLTNMKSNNFDKATKSNENDTNHNNGPTTNKDFTDYKTANKELNESNELKSEETELRELPMTTTTKMFVDRDNDINIHRVRKFSEDVEPPFQGFEHSEIAMAAFEESFAKSQSIFEKLKRKIKNNNATTFKLQNNEEHKVEINKFKGFHTANNKPIKISPEAMARTIEIFNDIDITNEKNMLDIPKELHTVGPQIITFQTASKKEIKISQKALARSKKIFQDIKLQENTSDKYKNSTLMSFQTASNKKVTVSDAALEKSRKILQEVNTDPSIETDKLQHKSLFGGFQTASNKEVKISEHALARSNRIFQEMEAETKQLKQTSFISGFQTESNKIVEISEEAYAKSKMIFQDLEELDKHSKIMQYKSSFSGLQTASNQDVKISEEALAKSRQTLQDIDIETKKIDQKSSFCGFQTASNKDVQVSEEALAKSRQTFQDIDIKTKKIYPNSYFCGFQTASNKDVKVSEEALAKSRQTFQDIDIETKKIDQKSSFCGFQTASNKDVQVSGEALAKSRQTFQDIDIETKNIDQKRAFCGFQTASNKDVKVSEEALAKSRKMFQDIDIETKNIDQKRAFCGFQTASNKYVKVSEEALAKSRKMFQDIDIETKKIDQKSSFCGFQTASNKDVNVSEEALAKSRKMFQYIDIETKKIDQKSSFCGFQTASNKDVQVSEEALAKSRQTFQDIDIKTKKIYPNSYFCGFQTASNTDVKVSEEALAKSRQTFQKIDIETNKVIQKSLFCGFQTASNKDVKVSEDALARSRKLFHELDVDIDLISNEITHKKQIEDSQVLNFGFKTANKNKISVSKESLAKSKKLVSDFDERIGTINTRTDKDISDKKINSAWKNHVDNFDSLINTQVLNNFEESLNTEDFLKETTPRSKRSGSPILSCPKPKKRKVFKIPYSQKVATEEHEFVPPNCVKNPENVFVFDDDYKKIKTHALKDLLEIEKGLKGQENIDLYLLKFDYDNLLAFEFSGVRNDIKLNDKKPTLNFDDLKNIFLNSVNKKLVPDGWPEIHFRLILWKLISYEIKFPRLMANVCTAKNVIDQLKYRYDKELYNAERPALRKIMEKDDTSMRMLVLCVVDIYNAGIDNSGSPEILLTDGWYTIRSTIDKMLAKMVQNGKIIVGTKLVTHGAELVSNDQAVSPWEDTSQIRLKLFGNSTRRARWHARLGYHGKAAILSRLSHVSQDGGKVSKLRVLVTRVYPALYVEKFEDGSTVTRSERLESIHQMKYESERQALLEKIYEDVEKEIHDQDSQDSESDNSLSMKRQCLDSGTQIAKMMKRSKDPTEFRSHLTASQTSLLNNHTAEQREKLIQKIQDRVQSKMTTAGLNITRNVVPLLKLRVAGLDEKENRVEISRAMLSIWKPNDAIVEMIKEDTWIEILNVVPTAVRYSEIQISAGRQSVFSQSKYKESDKLKPYTKSLKRTCYAIKNLVRNPAMTTDYNEIDVVGIVFQIDPLNIDFDLNKHQFQNVYICDTEKNIICVNFWGGLKKFGYENVLDTGQILAATNLQKRAGNTRKSIPQYRVTEFTYFTKTPKNESARKIIEELCKDSSKIDKKKFFDDCVALKNNYSAKFHRSDNVSPYRFPNMDVNLSKHRIFLDSPLAHKSKKIDDNLNLTGLDFESTFKQTDTQDLTPKTLLRKKQVQQKMAKLQMYGEPPPLSPLQIINKSKNAGSAYKSPLVAKSDVSSNSVASVKKNVPIQKENEQILRSPVVSLNRTYVKRTNVNPVKLNFSNNVANDSNLSEVIDDFAEDFDGSPPLSLD